MCNSLLKAVSRWEANISITQNDTPIIDALSEYIGRAPAYFKIPAHRSGRGVSSRLSKIFGEDVFKFDLTETPLTDDLHLPTAAIRDAENLAAELFGARRTFFLINGSTCGIEAMIIAASVKTGRCALTQSPQTDSSHGAPQNHPAKIALARNSHKSAMMGLIISGANPVYILPEWDDGLGVYAGVTPESVEHALKTEPDIVAVLVTSPTYYGQCSDIRRIADVCHAHGAMLLVDEAHGAHLYFDKNRKGRGALDCGADMVTQSIHKTAGSLTQSSMLHIGVSSLINDEDVSRALKMVQSTSPSYLLLASLDAARYELAKSGDIMFSRAVRLADYIRAELAGVRGVQCYAAYFRRRVDESRLVISCADIGVSGFDLADKLFADFGIDIELADERNIVAITTHANTEDDVNRLVAAIRDIAEQSAKSVANREMPGEPARNGDVGRRHLRGGQVPSEMPPPEMLMTPREAYFAECETVSWEAACGRISAEAAIPYPPGIPVICPGEKISPEIWAYIERCRAAGGRLHGISDLTFQTYQVIK